MLSDVANSKNPSNCTSSYCGKLQWLSEASWPAWQQIQISDSVLKFVFMPVKTLFLDWRRDMIPILEFSGDHDHTLIRFKAGTSDLVSDLI